MSKFHKVADNVKNVMNFLLRTVKIILKGSTISSIVTLIITIFNGIIISLNVVVSKYIIDNVVLAVNNKSYVHAVYFWVAVEFGLAVFSSLINRVNAYFCRIQVKELNNYIAKLIIEKSNELDLSYFENSDFYNKMQKANDQASSATISIVYGITDMIKSFSILVGAVVIVIQLNPLLLGLCMLTAIPMFFVDVKISRMIYDVYSKRTEKTRFARNLQKIMLHYNSIKEVKLNRIGHFFQNIILSIYSENLRQDKNVGKKQFKELSLIDCLNTVISYIYKLYIIFLTLSRGLTIGSMTMYMSALTNVDTSVKETLGGITGVYENNLYIENLFYVLDLKPKISDNALSKIFNNTVMNCIEFRNVSFKYPNSNNYVLKNVSFKIKANESCAIVGLNGCGKTTLIKLLTRLYDPAEGEIYIDGVNIKEYSIESLYKGISVVFQDYMKYPFTVKDNIGFGNIENKDNMTLIESCARKSRAFDFIDKLDNKFDTKLEKIWENGVELSLGQWQKLAIARAFMSNASILILDEPTASVDAKSEYELFKNFKELVGNRTSILISHRFSTVKMADLILVLNQGKIVEEGTHDSLMQNNGLYAELFTMQAEAYNMDSDKEKSIVND
ncbi:ABC transporter ATP-binding protein [Clostridium sp. 19966]|uniref:ABC transporter ATP-binding protein n=1 Tax=Clostridium sp. 19966 TaxID=2768166 RepID=UPI0028E0296B|nr:ABC transporter ATP-binding protein [Clostridium sp. 19966]MDT8715350.1 ABC transporter ATP-binding protein [Clostridium sp. 19966]